jgi:hypothetical protein
MIGKASGLSGRLLVGGMDAAEVEMRDEQGNGVNV